MLMLAREIAVIVLRSRRETIRPAFQLARSDTASCRLMICQMVMLTRLSRRSSTDTNG